MYKQLRPTQVQSLVGNSAVNGEFTQKIRELNRRLDLNGLSYRDWDTMTDNSQQAFSDGIFLTGNCATSVNDYVDGALDNCGCPDVVEELHHHSPALMGEIEKQQEMLPDATIKIGESVRGLNEFIDREVGIILREASEPVQHYEQRVVDALAATGIQGSMAVAHADATGPDAEFVIEGQPYFLEIKLNSRAQMGDTAVRYYPNRSDGRFELAKPQALDEAAKEIVFAALAQKEEDILNWVEALRDPARPASEKWVSDPDKSALGFQTTYRKYQAAKDNGLLLKAGAGYGKAPSIAAPGNIIKKLYASKNVHYIQIGGKGLYYLESNPANLPIPPFEGKINIELRPRPSGRIKTVAIDPETQEKVVTGYKVWSSPVDATDEVIHYGGTYSVTARFISKDLQPSPYTMDDPTSIEKMLASTSAEDPAEPEGLEVEPKESEGL
tara:strand:- start:25 stop:1347 length:1323 start_codon:yes stop_codon:yes gene_type:complete